MKLKRFSYKSTPQTRAQAQSVIAHAEGRIKEPKGFIKRVVAQKTSGRPNDDRVR